MWFPVHLKGPMIPDPSGQLAELIVYITFTRVDLYSHQSLLLAATPTRSMIFFHTGERNNTFKNCVAKH